MSRQEQKEQEEEDTQNYINNFMNQILINPLARIGMLLNNGDTLNCLVAQRNYIVSLPPATRKELEPSLAELGAFFKGYNEVGKTKMVLTAGSSVIGFKSLSARNYNHLVKKRQAYISNYGSQLAGELYAVLYEKLYSGEIFEALTGTQFNLKGQGPSRFKIRR